MAEGMRDADGEVHPAAIAREKRKTVKFWAGLVIAGAGLAAVFLIDGALYVGFGAALVGTKLVPFDKLVSMFKK